MVAYVEKIALALAINEKQVANTLNLINEGATVPFIARYRKEVTGSLDEVQISSIRDEYERLTELEKRREFILKTIEDQGKLSPELKKKLLAAQTLSELEDLYLPYKPKRRTKATVAREKGLEPLAQLLFEQNMDIVNNLVGNFIDEEKGVKDTNEALEGARDIIAEWVSEDTQAREKIRHLFDKEALVKARVLRGKNEEAQKYKDYFEWEEPLSKAPSHRVLAIRRGEKEGFLAMDIEPEEERAIAILKPLFVKNNHESGKHVRLAVEDSYKRLLSSSIETETRLMSKKKADIEAIKVFADNLRELLLASPLGQKTIMAIDPGFRTGCKVVVLDRQGKLLDNTAIYPNEPQKDLLKAEAALKHFVAYYEVEAIAIGNGTASRETESFVKGISFDNAVPTIMVNESGASIYSASEVARREFPDHDVTVRGAVSIGRRLADPLAELVKLDPKSIGVGQYQHDVDQNSLKKALDDVVSSCVNAVGVEVNTASKELLTYVSGLGPVLAENIVKYRNENGPFKSRQSLLAVPRMGEKAFQQAAGFLRLRNAQNPLDASAVHPESYEVVAQMAKDLNSSVAQLMKDASLRKRIKLQAYVSDTVGIPTLSDIINELDKPGRDPRKSFELFSFQDGVDSIEDLKVGMRLPGIVTNVTNFGAFVDVGVHQDGLVHVSQLANKFVSDPNQVVKVQQQVMVRVTEVDVPRKRISLSMKEEEKSAKSKVKQGKNQKPQKGNMQDQLSKLKGKWGG